MDSSHVEHGATPVARGRNPDWSRDETVLLMDLYLSAPRAEKRHPEVIALSAVLRAAGRRDRRAVLPSFRNPAGIAMRLRNFAKQDPQAPTRGNAGLRSGGAVDRLVWQEFVGDRAALALEAARIRRSISAEDWSGHRRSSRGPAPTFGVRTNRTTDGACIVYILVVEGPLPILAPSVEAIEGYAVFKIGRTIDVDRRMAELSSGLPFGAAIRYIPVGLKPFASAVDAHRDERRLLDFCDRNGWSLGGEFAYAPTDCLKSALVDIAADGRVWTG
jgi:hypothetical protein